MKGKQILNGIFLIENFIEDEKFNSIKDIIFNLKYTKFIYDNIEDEKLKNYWLEVFYFSDYKFIRKYILEKLKNEIENARKFAEIMYKEQLVFNNMEWIFKMNKWWWMREHTDDYATIQCVLYFANWDMSWKWWNLYISENGKINTIYVKENSLLMFKWKIPHWVDKYLWDKPRYSMPFWFDNEKNSREKDKTWIKTLKILIEKYKNYY